MYTETILWTLGEQFGRSGDASGESGRLGINVVRSFVVSSVFRLMGSCSTTEAECLVIT